jgi:hypothetical protein
MGDGASLFNVATRYLKCSLIRRNCLNAVPLLCRCKHVRGRCQKRPQLASGGCAKFLECRAFQTVKVALARRRLLKDMLRHLKRRDRFSD